MAIAYVISRVIVHPTKPILIPKLDQYVGNYEVKADGTNWCVVIVDNDAEIPGAANSDPDLFILNTVGELDVALAGPKRTNLNNVLAQTTWGVTALSGETARQVLNKIRIAMGHSPQSWNLGL